MTNSSRAPELSATFSRVSCWITYLALSTISTRRQRLSRESGRHSVMRTTSPIFASFFSSCALKRVDLRTIFPYCGCGTRVSVTTTIVLSILFEATRPCLMRRFGARSTLLCCSMLLLGHPLLGDDGLNARVRPTHRTNFAEIAQMTGTQRETKVEHLTFGLASFLL
uniref:Uncharacterized protein n=1 Tax=mine drainage metagenome TaxID=410659 RepID=E6PDK1_9ZZZZ